VPLAGGWRWWDVAGGGAAAFVTEVDGACVVGLVWLAGSPLKTCIIDGSEGSHMQPHPAGAYSGFGAPVVKALPGPHLLESLHVFLSFPVVVLTKPLFVTSKG
jgi:hypothetical protein